MTLRIVRSNQSEALIARAAAVLSAPSEDPFRPDVVVVHGRGLETWAQMQIADALGVAAHLRSPTLDDLAIDVARASLGVDLDGWRRDVVRYAALAALEDPAFDADVPRRWIDAGDPVEVASRRVVFAGLVADAFTRAAWHRPDTLAALRDPRGGEWDQRLFQVVERRIGAPPPLVAFASDAPLDVDAERILVLSVSSLSAFHLGWLRRLAHRRDVHWLQLAPGPGAWAAARSGPAALDAWFDQGPPLSRSLGGAARETHRRLAALPDAADAGDDAFCAPDGATLLARVQRAVYDGRVEPARIDETDRSIEIHGATGAARQVQVLRERLLALLDADPSLEPRDIVVMTPDVDTFGPLIEGTFEDGAAWSERHTHPGGLARLRFRLADRGLSVANPVATALIAALDLLGSRFEASRVVDLASIEPVREHLGLASADLPILAGWVARSGARWGRDAAHRAEVGLRGDLHSWRFALDRLLFGLATPDERPVAGVYAAPTTGRTEDLRAVGAVVTLVERLLRAHDTLSGVHPLAGWRDALWALVDDLVGPSGADRGRVRGAIGRLASDAAAVGADPQLDRAAVRALLEEHLAQREPGAGFLSGAITVCQLVPMRSVPFRVVALLGLDDGAFPRADADRDLDRSGPRTPDEPSIRQDDRSLFLEAVGSARDRLLVFGSDREPRTGRPRPFASPVLDLLDTIDAIDPDARARVVRSHPLHPWGPGDLDPADPVTHDPRWLRAARAAHGPRVDAPPFLTRLPPAPPGPIELGAVGRFLKDAADFALRDGLGLWAAEDDDPVADEEPLASDALERWALRDRALQAALRGEDLSVDGPLFALLAGSGELPVDAHGRRVWRDTAEFATDLAEKAAPWWEPLAPPRTVAVTAGGRGLVGRVSGRRGDALVQVQAGPVRDHQRLVLWARQLALAVAGDDVAAVLIGADDVVVRPPLGARAAPQLADLLELVEAGRRVPLPFLAAPARLWFDGFAGDAAKAWSKAVTYGSAAGRVFGDALPVHARPDGHETWTFDALARRIWGAYEAAP